MSFTIVLLLMSALAAVSTQKPKCLITAPNIVHLGVEETVTVQLHGATKPMQVNMYFEHQTAKVNKIISKRQNVYLNEGNDYLAVVKMKVITEAYTAAISGTNSGQTNTKQRPAIQLTVESEEIFLQNKETKKYYAKKNIILSTRKGYIFIQTDKPIYNPGENVKFRVFTLDNYLMPVDEKIQVRIFNSRGLMVDKQTVQESYIIKKTIRIPDVEIAGHWTILASYLHHPMSNSTVQFEVREYVLPRYEVKIEALKPYYLLTEDSFTFNVTVRYTYGKRVNGIAYVRFGLIDNEQGNTTYLTGLENKNLIQDGIVTIALLTRDLREKVHQIIEHMEGYSLYIAVTAIDTASGDLEEAESTVPIVNTPYIIDLSKTKEYFTPGGMFSVLATTTYPDGIAAPQLRLKAVITAKLTEGSDESIKVESPSDSKGQVALTFKAPRQAKSMDIKVFAEGEEKEVILSDAEMTVTAPKAERGSYLSVEIENRILEPGQEMTITLRDITPPNTPRPSYIYYMILSKGKVVQMSRIQRTELTTLRLPFSVDLVPSFRLLAYYFSEDRDPAEATIVADSVWADVKDICQGNIEILPFKERKPAEVFSVEVRTDQADKVALSAVDTAVYILNKKNKLTLQKMFDYMNSYDLACTMGGGRDYTLVLGNAGLAFITNVGEQSEAPDVRKDYTCQSQGKRQKRALNQQQEMSKIINRYKDKERRCCFDGAKPRDLSCEQRYANTQHQPQKCRDAFLKCCRDATKLRQDIKIKKRKTHSLARAGEDVGEEEEMLNDMSARLRSYFPQTWMWDIVDVDVSGNISHKVSVPDSITTWEVQAVGISAKKGFCIAEPKPLTVFQDFFVSLKLPYSVKRNEQLEVKAVVYNYQAESLEVTVEMAPVDGLCSAVGDKQEVTVPANSAVPVYFTVVPLRTGNIPIHVDAYTDKARDQIKKDLKVLGEGELFSQQTEINIDPRTANTVTLDVPIPRNSVPGGELDAYVSVKGGVMGQSLDNCLNVEGINKLIALPKGCAEQTMVTMSPAIHAMNYLDSTGEWIDLRAERRDEALAMIQSGYSRILMFKKQDGSYGAFLSRPSSIWLTAFIAKELTQSRTVIVVEDSYIQESISYLVSKQLDSGAFNDPNPLYDRTMQGGVGGFEADVSLTAYVLIAMHQALPIYTEDSSKLSQAIQKSQRYLEAKLDSLQRPFAVAITAYALSLTSSSAATQAQTKLRGMAICDQEADTCHWESNKNLTLIGEERANKVPQAIAISVETTAYALLQTVAARDIHYATRIARWLTEQRKYGGGFQSTQDTVLALEALVKFSSLDNLVDNLDLNVELCEQGGQKYRLHITKRSALNLPAFQVTPGRKITVNVGGQGNGTISLIQTYRTLEQTETSCDYFNLTISVEGEVKYRKSEDSDGELDDYYNYELEDEPSDEPVSRVEWFDLRTRRKRQAPQEEEREKSLVYHVCVGVNNGTSTGMVIVDVSLLSGLQPNLQDLEENVKGTERYIDHYDIAPNKVYLYFDKITEIPQCVTFRAEQISPIGLVQPAGVVVYDYYNPEIRCGVFYSVPQRSSMVSKLCKKDVCSCAEGGCPKLKITYSKDMKDETRSTFACFSPTVDYAFTGKIINSSDDGVFKHHTTLLTRILQIAGKDVTLNGAVRDMIVRKACQIDLKTDREYLIMGRDKTISDITDDSGKPIYVLDNEMWLEEIPEEKRCRASKNRGACNMLQDFMQKHETNQCHF